jgi:hypothetical protein
MLSSVWLANLQVACIKDSMCAMERIWMLVANLEFEYIWQMSVPDENQLQKTRYTSQPGLAVHLQRFDVPVHEAQAVDKVAAFSTLPADSPCRLKVEDHALHTVEIEQRAILTNLGERDDTAVLQRSLCSQKIVAVGMVKLHEEFDLLLDLVHKALIRLSREGLTRAGNAIVRAHMYGTLTALPKQLALFELCNNHVVEALRVRGWCRREGDAQYMSISSRAFSGLIF